jgi:hypothetical protein
MRTLAGGVEAQPSVRSEDDLPILLMEALEREEEAPGESVEILRRLVAEHHRWGLSKEWLLCTLSGLETGDWSLLGEPFLKLDFIGETGAFLIVGPYTITREGQTVTRLSGVYGTVIPHPPMPPLDMILQEMFGSVPQSVTRVLPISAGASAGLIGSEAGEAFVVPDGWGFPFSAAGPALNDMEEQSKRFLECGRECIHRIFEPRTAELLLSVYSDDEARIQLQHQEYQFHEAGHATGIGLMTKLREGLLATWWHGAVEEWRADGVAFAVALRLLPEDEVGRLVASNFCTRFGIDSHRSGGSDRDRDVAASLLTLDQLLRGGGLVIKGQQLSLKDPSYRGLVRATALHRAAAMRFTEIEAGLQYPIGIHGLYGSIAVEQSSRVIFEGLIRELCFGIFRKLR